MVHFNFGKSEWWPSYSIEAGFWHFNQQFASFGFDIGIEIEKNKTRFYSEIETGAVFLGVAVGPVIELTSLENNKYLHSFGFQSSFWGAFFGGFDLRYRKLDRVNYFCPGLFVKYVDVGDPEIDFSM